MGGANEESESDVSEVVDALVKRATLLDRLRGGPTSKRDLRDELDVSRSTVYKAVRELEDRDLVEQTDAGCRLTLLGRLLADEYREFIDVVGHLDRHRTLLSVLPADAPVAPTVLVGAEHVLTERYAPNRPLERIEKIVRSSDRVVGLSPVAVPRYVDLFHGQLVAGELTAELVLETPVVEYMQTEHGDRFAEAIGTGRLTVWVTDETLPFGLIVGTDDRETVTVTVYDETGDLRGLILNDSRAALDWAESVFREYRDRADEVE